MTAKSSPRVNDAIRAPQVLLIGADGTAHGVVDRAVALRAASTAGLDLVEVAAGANPPVCKIMDWGHEKYEASLREREQRRASKHVTKEIKLRPKIDDHDFGVKVGHVRRFLSAGHQVKVTIMMRGREISRPQLAVDMLNRVIVAVADCGKADGTPVVNGRDGVLVLRPLTVASQPRRAGDDHVEETS